MDVLWIPGENKNSYGNSILPLRGFWQAPGFQSLSRLIFTWNFDGNASLKLKKNKQTKIFLPFIDYRMYQNVQKVEWNRGPTLFHLSFEHRFLYNNSCKEFWKIAHERQKGNLRHHGISQRPRSSFSRAGLGDHPFWSWGEGKEGQIELFSLCGCLGRLELSDYRTFLESRKRLLPKLIFRCHRSAEVPFNQLSYLWFDSLIKSGFP